MTIVTNTAVSFTFAGITNQEDVRNVIYNIAPTDCPFTTGIGKTKARNTLHEWQIDTLAAAATNAQIEGDDITSFDTIATPTRPGNRSQILRKTLIVAKTEDAVAKYGMKRLFVYELLKKTKELKRDIEFAAVQNQAVVVGTSATARQMRGFEHWVGDNQGAFNGTNSSRGTTGANAASATAALTDGTQRPFTEALLKPVLQTIAIATGDPVDKIMVGAFNKAQMSTFSGNVTRTQDTSDKKLVSSIDVYVSDFGSHKIVFNRFSRARTALLVNSEYWKLATLRPQNTVDLATTGDATKGMVIVELTLEASNEQASGVVADLTTS